MTFKELNEKLGGSEQESDWHQHKNGGGWVHKSATVDESAFIGDKAIVWGKVSGDAWVYGNARVSGDARVYGNARVSGDARVYGNAQVSGDARVYGNAQVYGDAWVSGDARVSGNARVSGDARVYGNAQVSGDARVYGDAWKSSPLFIVGSKYSLTNCKKGHIQIGCHCHEFDWWLKNGEKLAEEMQFTKDEIDEYRAYVELFIQIGK